MVDGKAADIAIQPIPNDSLTTYYIYIYIERDCIYKLLEVFLRFFFFLKIETALFHNFVTCQF